MIVDDHPFLRDGLRAFLDRQPDIAICAEAESGRECMRKLNEVKPDVIVLDLTLKGEHGMNLIGGIRALHPSVRILVLSMHDEELFCKRALQAGAHGYVSKGAPRSCVLDAIRKLVAGGVYVSEQMQQKLVLDATGRAAAKPANPFNALTNREMVVLHLIAQGKSTREIAQSLAVSPKTIEAHRVHIKAKLGVQKVSQLMRLAIEYFNR